MQAVSDQKVSFSTLSYEFGKKLHDHLISKFNQLAARRLDAITSRGSQGDLPRLPAHTNEHNDLMQYCELTKWMRDCQIDRFASICQVSKSIKTPLFLVLTKLSFVFSIGIWRNIQASLSRRDQGIYGGR